MGALSMDSNALRRLLDGVRDGHVSIDEAAERIRESAGAYVRLFVALLLWFVSVLYLLGRCMFEWALRDGLGPNSVESHGWAASSRFFVGIQSDLMIAVIPIAIGCLLYPRDRGLHRLPGSVSDRERG
jgi:hypothetical protein